MVSIAPRPLYPWERTVVVTVLEGEWAPLPVRTVIEKKYFPQSVFEHGTIRSVRYPATKANQGDNISCLFASRESLWGSGGMAPTILTLGSTEDEWSASCPGRLTTSVSSRSTL